MLSRRDRRARHIAAAGYFERLADDEVAGIVASHYLDAYRSQKTVKANYWRVVRSMR